MEISANIPFFSNTKLSIDFAYNNYDKFKISKKIIIFIFHLSVSKYNSLSDFSVLTPELMAEAVV